MNQVLALQTALESVAPQADAVAPPSCSSQSIICTIITK